MDDGRRVNGGRRPVLDEALLLGGSTEIEIVLVRHAQQEMNALNDPARPRAGDASLSRLGEQQAEAVGAALAGEQVDAVVTSHLRRAHDTAARIAVHHGVVPVVDQRIREIGIYEQVPAGRTVRDEIGEAGLDDLHARFEQHRTWDVFPLSESSDAVTERAFAALADVVRMPGAERVVVVSHTGVINSIVARVTGSRMDAIFYPAHTSLTRLAWGRGRFVVRTLNEHHHLRAVGPATY